MVLASPHPHRLCPFMKTISATPLKQLNPPIMYTAKATIARAIPCLFTIQFPLLVVQQFPQFSSDIRFTHHCFADQKRLCTVCIKACYVGPVVDAAFGHQ